METVDLVKITKRTVSVDEYIDKMRTRFKEKFLEKKQAHQQNVEIVRKIKDYAKDVALVVFSAEWCKYCTSYVSILALLAEKTGIPVRVFGGLKTNPLDPKEIWRIPPSPPEVKTFNVQETPHIIIFDRHGKELGTIVGIPENTLEKEILHIVSKSR